MPPSVVRRLEYEMAMVRSIVSGVPLILLSIAGYYCVSEEYPVWTFNKIQHQIGSTVNFSRETGLSARLPSILVSSIVSAGSLASLQKNSTGAPGHSSTLLGSLFYHGRAVRTNCPGRCVEDSSDCPALVCFDRTMFNATYSTNGSVPFYHGQLLDPNLGYIPVEYTTRLSYQDLGPLGTGSWLDDSSSLVVLTFLFYTPYFDMYTVAQARFPIDSNSVFRSDFLVNTYRNVRNASVLSNLLQVCLALSGIVFVVDLARPGKVTGKLFCLLTSAFSAILFSVKIIHKINFAQAATNVILSNAFDDLTSAVALSDSIRACSSILLVLLLFRLILLLSLHPRLGVLVGTLRVGFDDFIHFLFVMVTLLLWFAFVACLLFGQSYYYMSTYTRSVFVHFQFLMGSLGLETIETTTNFSRALLVAYLCIFGVVMFFGSLYFLLALIVNAYERYDSRLSEEGICGTFLGDLWAICVVWPPKRQRLYHVLTTGKSKLSPALQTMGMRYEKRWGEVRGRRAILPDHQVLENEHRKLKWLIQILH